MKIVHRIFIFPHTYQVETLAHPPPDGALLHFPELPPGEKMQDGMLVRVTPPKRPAWVGNFAYGYDSPFPYNGMLSCPNEDTLCVVAAGYGYMVPAAAPRAWKRVACNPVLEVLPLSSRGLLVFVDFTKMVAYNREGLAWETERLSWEGLKITEITPDRIRGLAWDGLKDKEVEFVVDTRTGRHEGGARP